MLKSRKRAGNLDGRRIRKSAPRQYYLLTCGAVSSLSIYAAVRTIAIQPWSAPPPSQLVAAGGIALAVIWFGLLIVQTVLIQLQRTFDHKRLGQIGTVTGIAAPIVSLIGAVLRAREQAGLPGELYSQAEMMVVVHLANSLTFLTSLGLALARREASDFHRRWMLIAMLALVPEAVMGPDPTAGGLVAIYGCLDVLLLVTAARDILRLGRVHRAYRMTLTPLLLVQAATLAIYIGRWPILLAVIDSFLSGRL